MGKSNPLKRNVYLTDEWDARLKALGGSTRAENIRRAVALAECAGELAEALEDLLGVVDNYSPSASAEAGDNAEEAINKYREIKHED